MKITNLESPLARLRAACRGLACLGLMLLGAAFVQQASAGCLQYEGPFKPSVWQQPGAGPATLTKVGFRYVADEGWPDHFGAPIVGLWHFTYLSSGNASKPPPINIPDGAMVDGGNTIWFADGNELTYSGVRDPTTGATCLGVWKQTGERTYVLNHIGLSWNPPNNPANAPVGPGGPAFIKQYVTLSRDGNSYTGTFTITQLGPDGKTLALPGVITGNIVATRVNINTTTQEP
ncbi:MAG TPA: hypothetical protein VMF03_17245 [Steroidobacteraceae bacterium]|nr:hypothetical protein [Steroidobacteraceae bacterium]